MSGVELATEAIIKFTGNAFKAVPSVTTKERSKLNMKKQPIKSWTLPKTDEWKLPEVSNWNWNFTDLGKDRELADAQVVFSVFNAVHKAGKSKSLQKIPKEYNRLVRVVLDHVWCGPRSGYHRYNILWSKNARDVFFNNATNNEMKKGKVAKDNANSNLRVTDKAIIKQLYGEHIIQAKEITDFILKQTPVVQNANDMLNLLNKICERPFFVIITKEEESILCTAYGNKSSGWWRYEGCGFKADDFMKLTDDPRMS